MHCFDALVVMTFVINGEANYAHIHLTLGAVRLMFVANVLAAETASQFHQIIFVLTVNRNYLMSSARNSLVWFTA
jgi:hypothetical protein